MYFFFLISFKCEFFEKFFVNMKFLEKTKKQKILKKNLGIFSFCRICVTSFILSYLKAQEKQFSQKFFFFSQKEVIKLTNYIVWWSYARINMKVTKNIRSKGIYDTLNKSTKNTLLFSTSSCVSYCFLANFFFLYLNTHKYVYKYVAYF